MTTSERENAREYTGLEIAVIGLAGRFPGAADVDAYWRNIRDGVETIRFFTPEEMASLGVDPAIAKKPNFIAAHGALDGADLFDAGFFGFNPREAEIIDPQHRLFLEAAWTALENAGYDANRYAGSIGVFGGSSVSTYLYLNVLENPQVLAAVGEYQARLNNLADTLANRASYKLNLTGPAFSVQSTCSTSLVAVHVACQALLGGTCDIALAGGVSLTMPQKRGYLYKEGMIYSPDGHCRPFDAKARGTLAGDGVGIVVLKRLADALADGDSVDAVVLATAANNDGSDKVGYTAPSVGGQVRVIRDAQAVAGIDPETIGLIEAHGTGTPLGDPIEVSALTLAFRASTQRRGYCALGSVKSNMGHLDAAAGVAGFIKAVLSVRHATLPPSLHYTAPNPEIDFASSPFYVNTKAQPWTADGHPRRAGVNSFGIGGTNAHAIVESAPAPDAGDPDSGRPVQVLVLSARSIAALDVATANLAEHLAAHPDTDLADAAYTLQIGRRPFAHRRAVVARDAAEARAALVPERGNTAQAPGGGKAARVAFLFPGQGSQYVGMGRELYDAEPVFRQHVDECAELLRPHLGFDLREAIHPAGGPSDEAERRLRQTAVTQPALFVVQYALAKLWMSWGVQPAAMVGHSVAEYTAACLAGVMSLEDALALVAARGRLMQALPAGAMLAVPLPPDQLAPLLGPDLSLAVVNAPALSVAAGPAEAIAGLEKRLAERNVDGKRLHTSHAFHSAMMQPMVEPLRRLAASVSLSPPRIPFVSTVTGTWITPEQATSPDHWARNVREPVRFADAVGELLKKERVLLEVGPGNTLTSLAKAHGGCTPAHTLLASLRHPRETQPDQAFILRTLGKLWAAGVEVDWRAFHGESRRRRLHLPTYPFERSRYWVDPQPQGGRGKSGRAGAGRREEISDWFYVPAWRTAALPVAPASSEMKPRCLVLGDAGGLGLRLAQRLRDAGHEVVVASLGERFAKFADGSFSFHVGAREDYVQLLGELAAQGQTPDAVFHLLNVTNGGLASRDAAFFSLLFLAQAIGEKAPGHKLQIKIVSDQLHAVLGDEAVDAGKALLLGPTRVIPQEYAGVQCVNIDLPPKVVGGGQEQAILDALVRELDVEPGDLPDRVVAYRSGRRWVEDFQPHALPAVAGPRRVLRDRGVYL
ncbi:MAG: beta-ketoacyl synthase N-terminal-like domain-containing protein, partial [Planctomycetota bacterium]|nr:beta-ketoacyl synthase N-terminal-like domain-containing protein [Planctomycetota bacterium]